MNYTPGMRIRFDRGDGIFEDVIRGNFIAETLLEPYGRNEHAPALILTEHSWCHESDVVEIVGGNPHEQEKLWTGADAVNMAETPGRMAGPGYERWVVREWVKAAGGVANVSLKRQWNVKHPDYPLRYPRECWMWSLMTPDGRFDSRFTRPWKQPQK